MELTAEAYKQTDIGIIPSDWDVEELGDVCSKIQDGNYGGSYPKSNEFLPIGIPFLTSKAIGKDGVLKENLIDFISSEKHALLAKAHLELNDVLFTNRGASVGTIGFVDSRISNGNIGPQLTLLRANPQLLDAFYLFQVMKSHAVQYQMLGKDAGSAMNFFGIGTTKKFQIPLPPTKEEQTVIAEALSDADNYIASLEKLIAKKRLIKQGAVQNLLTPKEGWEEKMLCYYLDYEQPTNYLVSDTEYHDNNDIPVLTAGKTFILGYTNEKFGVFDNLPVIIFDDFTTATKYVDFPFKAKSSAMKMLVPQNNTVNMRFIYELMQRIDYPMGIGDHKRHWIADYQCIEILVPQTIEEQTEIATILSDMDTEITTLEQKLAKAQQLKQGMMQQLLTGKIRLL